jgi:ParB/RepB/Spo0J family partition protein
MSKRSQTDQIAAIKARLAQQAQTTTTQAEEPAGAPAAPEIARQEQARQHFLGQSIEALVANRVVERMKIGLVAPELRPGMRQPRLIPLPDELMRDSEESPAYTELVAELRALGDSMKEQQIQPIIVYPGQSDSYPTARYLILIGQRRWTAAVLVGLEGIDAIIVDPPSSLERIKLQYAENETREDFSDIERAWTIRQLREAMGGDQVAINTVAAQLTIKRSRAYQLLRLLAFTPEQQQTIALLRLQERQLVALTDALNQGALSHEQVDVVLRRLSQIAEERALNSRQLANTETTQTVDSPRRSGIDAATIARLVARVSDAKLQAALAAAAPRWYVSLRDDVAKINRKLRRAIERVDNLSADQQEELYTHMHDLQAHTRGILDRLDLGEE